MSKVRVIDEIDGIVRVCVSRDDLVGPQWKVTLGIRNEAAYCTPKGARRVAAALMLAADELDALGDDNR